MRTLLVATFGTIVLAMSACDTGEQMESDSDSATGSTGDTDTLDLSDVIIDARDDEAWVYYDLESGQEVEPSNPEDSPTWDLAFQRFNIAVNGGTSGSGDVAVALVDGQALEDVGEPPADGYVTDNVVDAPEDMETTPGYAFDEWYDYNPSNHVLTPRERVYVVRTVEGNYFKLQLTDYYDQAGTSGYVHFSLGSLP